MGYCGLTHLVEVAEMLSVYVSIYAPLSSVHTECTPLVQSIRCLDIFISQVCPVRSDSLSVSRISVAIWKGMNCEVKVSLNF